jgi:hypothetical protein
MLGEGKDTRASSEKVVPITREDQHYLEPTSHAFKRKIGKSGSEFGCYRNRGGRCPESGSATSAPRSGE